jgi:hypothetical protein
MTPSHTTETNAEPGFVCQYQEWVLGAPSACKGEPFYGEHEGKRYCVLHLPLKEKTANFNEALQRKITNGDLNFRGVWFPEELQFRKFQFGDHADFTYANFNGNAHFAGATFLERANFRETRFAKEAYFQSVIFKADADFLGAIFSKDAYFSYAVFSRTADFSGASFKAALKFDDASFGDYVRFSGFPEHVTFNSSSHPYEYRAFSRNSSLDLRFARIEKPDRFSFHTVRLSVSWFLNVDCRKFELADIAWQWRSIAEEIAFLKNRGLGGMGVLSPHPMVAIACRHLASNAEENHRYEEASKFRYMAMDARRLEHWAGFDLRRLSWWYWFASGYGERVSRAAFVLMGVLLIFAALYTQVGFARWEAKLASESEALIAKRDETGAPLKPSRALTYSAAVMTFQRPAQSQQQPPHKQ